MQVLAWPNTGSSIFTTIVLHLLISFLLKASINFLSSCSFSFSWSFSVFGMQVISIISTYLSNYIFLIPPKTHQVYFQNMIMDFHKNPPLFVWQFIIRFKNEEAKLEPFHISPKRLQITNKQHRKQVGADRKLKLRILPKGALRTLNACSPKGTLFAQ